MNAPETFEDKTPAERPAPVETPPFLVKKACRNPAPRKSALSKNSARSVMPVIHAARGPCDASFLRGKHHFRPEYADC